LTLRGRLLRRNTVAVGSDAIDRILKESRTIAVVGASDSPDRQSHGVMRT